MSASRHSQIDSILGAIGARTVALTARTDAVRTRTRAIEARTAAGRAKAKRAEKAELTRFRFALYTQVNTNFRKLTDIRFKLLTLLPLATGLGVYMKIGMEHVLLSLFAAVVTVALWVYDQRNDQHYDELVGQAAHLERRMKQFGGPFDARPGAWRRISDTVKVEHRWPIELIYGASLTVWLSSALQGALHELHGLNDLKAAIPAALVALAVKMVLSRLRKSKRTQEKYLKRSVREVHKRLTEFFERGGNGKWEVEQLVSGLIDDGYINSDPKDGVGLVVSEDTFRARFDYFLKNVELRLDVPDPGTRAAVVLGQMIDLPPRWIQDISGRRASS